MKKSIRISLIGVTSLIILLIIIFTGARYGWQLFGFDYCVSPHSVTVTNIDVKTDIITIRGNTTNSAPAFVGYIYKIDGDKMYIGLKYNALFGFSDRNGEYDIKIKYNSKSISSIYFKNKSDSKRIWNRE